MVSMNVIVDHLRRRLGFDSNVRALLAMPLQIPAWHIASAGKQRVDAGLDLWRIEDELRFAILLRHGVVAGNRDLSVGLAIRGEAVAEHSIVHGVGQERES